MGFNVLFNYHRHVSTIKKIINWRFWDNTRKVLKLEEENRAKKDEALKKEALEIGKEIRKNGMQTDLKIKLFGIVREVIYRKTKEKLLLYPSQIIGGFILSEGNIAQMNTGEGKTITAVFPACLHAFVKKKNY